MPTNLTALRTGTRRLISFQLTSTDFSDANIDASVNEWYRVIMAWVIQATGIWEIQGEMAKTDLVMNQVEYILPTDLVNIDRVEIKYSGQTEYVKMTRFDDKETDAPLSNNTLSDATTAAPYYRFFDNSIFVYPKPTAGSTLGLSIEYTKDVTSLSGGSDIPNLNPLVARALQVGAAYDYCRVTENPKANSFWIELFGRAGGNTDESLKHQIEVLAAQRDHSVRVQIRPKPKSYR